MITRLKLEFDDLIDENLDQIPEGMWISTNSTFFDPAFAGGQILKKIIERLRKYGHNDENIKSRIFGCEENVIYKNWTVNKTKVIGTLWTCDMINEGNNMKFDVDVIATNPPYGGQSKLYQRFFNQGVEMLKEGGNIIMIHPSAPYFNKKIPKSHDYDMQQYLKKYESIMYEVDSKVFDNADIANQLAVTCLTKKESLSDNIQQVTYLDDKHYIEIPLEHINMTKIPPDVYKSIRDKYYSYIKKNGCLSDVLSSDKNKIKARLPVIRGNTEDEGKSIDFYTLMARKGVISTKGDNKGNECRRMYDGFGIECTNEDEMNNIYSYLESYVARLGLSLNKFNTDLRGGATNLIPLISFHKTYTNQELYDMLDLTEEEIKVIKSTIPEYY